MPFSSFALTLMKSERTVSPLIKNLVCVLLARYAIVEGVKICPLMDTPFSSIVPDTPPAFPLNIASLIA